MKPFVAVIVLLAAALALPAYGGEVKLQVANGRITLQARDATVRDILAEWARLGSVKIVNGEKIMGGPVTLDLQSVPEAEALAILLRSVSGYMAAARPQPASEASIYDRIVIMAAPRTVTASTAYTQAPQQPQFRGGMPPGTPNPSMLDDQDEPAGPPPTYPGSYPGAPPGYVGPGGRGAMPGAQAPPVTGAVPQGSPGTVSPMPQMPGVQPGVVQPGLMIQPGTGAPGTVTQPVRKPGGPGGPGGGEK
jgi:hypothetical protein